MLFPFWDDPVSNQCMPSIRHRLGLTQAGMASVGGFYYNTATVAKLSPQPVFKLD
jgi:hypothetical protein